MKKIFALSLTLFLLYCCSCAQATELTILGPEAFWEVGFSQAHPELKLNHSASEATGQAYLTLLMTSEDYDAFSLPVGPVYMSLLEKGYLLPLSGTVENHAFADSLQVGFQAVLVKDGALYGAPIPSEESLVECVSLGVWTWNQAAWEEEGLGELPATYEELLEQMIYWEQHCEDSPYRLIEADLGAGGFSAAMFQAYVLQYETADGTIDFDTPVFRKAMTLMKTYGEMYQPLDARQALIVPYGGYMTEMGDNVWISPPAFEPGQTAPIPASLQVYAINARTQHPQEAEAYVQAAIQALNEPSLLILTTQAPQEIRSGKQVVLTQVQAQRVQKLSEQAQVNTRSQFLAGDHYYDMEAMIQQYLHGTLPLDQLIYQLNQRAQMAADENER